MVPPGADSLLGILDNELDKLRLFRWDVVNPRTGLDKLLPDQNPQTVTQIIERLFFDQSTAPNPQQIDIRVFSQSQQPLALSGCSTPYITSIGTQFQPVIYILRPLTTRL